MSLVKASYFILTMLLGLNITVSSGRMAELELVREKQQEWQERGGEAEKGRQRERGGEERQQEKAEWQEGNSLQEKRD